MGYNQPSSSKLAHNARPSRPNAPSSSFLSQDVGYAVTEGGGLTGLAKDFQRRTGKGSVPLMLATLMVSFTAANLWWTFRNLPEEDAIASKAQLRQDEDVSTVYDGIAKDYDSNMAWSEFGMGMPLLRRFLAKRLQGDVLEVSVGTGRNVKYYPRSRCKSITLVDSSPAMLDQARKQFREKHPHYKNVKFVLQDAAGDVSSLGGPDRYDTVIQSMGLCSVHEPIQLLHNLEAVCKKDGGKIILLEHGRSYYEWLNKILDRVAPIHAKEWGCWWNRDIEGILNKSGLRVDKIVRYHLGTTYWIEASPKQPEKQPDSRPVPSTQSG